MDVAVYRKRDLFRIWKQEDRKKYYLAKKKDAKTVVYMAMAI